MLVLDASASMSFPETGLSAWRYAQVLAASLAHLVVSQGDAAGLLAMSGERLTFIPAKGGRPHLRSLIATLDRLEPGGDWQPARAISRGAELLKRRGLVLVLSDFHDEEDSTRRELRRAARSGHDVSMLHVIAADERSFPYRGDTEFEDLETGERRRVDAGVAALAYREGLAAFLGRCQEGAVRDHIDYALLSTDVAPERALRDFLLRRGADRRRASA